MDPEKIKKEQDVKPIISSPLYGPHAEEIKAALHSIDIPAILQLMKRKSFMSLSLIRSTY